VFLERRLCTGRLMVRSQSVLPSAIHRTGLMTIEAQNDDIAAPGQTYAAHALCCGIPDKLRRHLLLSGSGHFSLFHGDRWRSGVLPPLLHFLETETRRTLS
jgi:poly(3-hydroxybutyrate) depolymerase